MAITPYLLYEDAGAALAWLTKAFGLRQSGPAMSGPDGKVTHASMRLGSAYIMLGCPGGDYRNPQHLGHVTQNLYVDLANADKHYARAVAAGARIIEEPTDTPYGHRRYGAEDLEGHRWYFAHELKVPKRAKRKPRKKAAAKRGSKRR
jgi:uncharacterized glyoxalase superfamily protein PhnB